MEETEKMVALKKAYAEIILNTAKEAAARVMVAERKAVRFQHDLRSTKEEALRMLLRFKQMIDAKIKVHLPRFNSQECPFYQFFLAGRFIRSLRKRKLRCWGDNTTSSKSIPSQFIETCQPSLGLSHCKTYWGNYGVRSKENRLKSKNEAEIRKDKGPALASRPVIVDTEPDKFVEDTDLVDVSISVKHEGEATENPGFSSWKIRGEADNVLSADSKATNGSQTDRNRLLKYTFSRKRKKGLLFKSDECSSLGNNSINNRTGRT